MMKKFISKFTTDGSTIIKSISELSKTSYSACTEMEKALNSFCSTGKDIDKIVGKIITKEKKADALVEKITRGLYSGRFLPFSSEDWFGMVNQIDRQADLAERIGRLMRIKEIKIPAKVKKDIENLGEKVVAGVKQADKAIMRLSADMEEARKEASKLPKMRENIRNIEYKIYNDIFSSQMNSKNVIILREIVYYLAQISNVSEDIANIVKAMTIKYSF